MQVTTNTTLPALIQILLNHKIQEAKINMNLKLISQFWKVLYQVCCITVNMNPKPLIFATASDVNLGYDLEKRRSYRLNKLNFPSPCHTDLK